MMMTSNVYIIPMDLTRSIPSIHFSIVDRFKRYPKVRWELAEDRSLALVYNESNLVAKIQHARD